MKLIATLFLLISSSCSEFIKMADQDYHEKIEVSGKTSDLKIIFSGNINGETHPCGCRHHPRGGLPQVAGVLHDLKSKSPVIYVDTGDTFFTSTKIPEPIKESSIHSANAIAEALKKLDISFFLPGDQDFALGEEFLAKLLEKNKIPVVVSNFGKTSIKHKSFGHIEFGDQNIFFIGILDPQTFFSIKAPDLKNPKEALQEVITQIKKEYKDAKNKKFILLSHSGMEADELLAKNFPDLNWVLGSHSQSFTNHPIKEGKVKLVQVLSRNHYLGEVSISSNLKKPATFKIHETSDEKKDLIKNSPWISWLDNYKTELEKIQQKEQGVFENDYSKEKFKTYTSCLECHQEQGKFWQTTGHAIAFETLIKAKSQHNPNCVTCHSLGYGNPKGFMSSHDIVLFDQEKVKPDQEKIYHEELSKIMKDIKSVRDTSGKLRAKKSDEWIKLDKKMDVTHNFANVQCLNCHKQPDDHPFDTSDEKTTVSMESQCIKCHTQDQSPEWYDKDDKGVATTLNKTYFAGMLKKVACPAK